MSVLAVMSGKSLIRETSPCWDLTKYWTVFQTWDRVGGKYAWRFSAWRFPLVCCSKPCLFYLDELAKVQILKNFRTLSCIVLFLASKCYMPALVWYPASVWVRTCFGRFAVTLQCIYWATVFRAPLKSSLKKKILQRKCRILVTSVFNGKCPMDIPLIITVCFREQVSSSYLLKSVNSFR